MQETRSINERIREIESRLPGALHCDRHAAEKELRRMRKGRSPKTGRDASARLARIEKRIERSAAIKQQRKTALPHISYDPELPIVEKREEIIRAITDHQVIIVSGETGSGKTTQLPKFCLEAGRGIEGRIGCTQPRRIAAVTVAGRIAEELGQKPGRSAGYKIRFSDRLQDQTAVKMMTDGILLAETQGDKFLNEYDTLIVDEAHERSLNIDFLLGLIRDLIRTRRDLKVIVTSATIDTEKFSRAFDDAPVIEVSGRMYPVEVRYMPPDSPGAQNGEYSYVDAAAEAMDRVDRESAFGDVLIFMPTERDIREICDILEGRRYKSASIMPLYARLPAWQQARVFAPAAGRKIVVATNVAETSITIPGIRYVIDTGLARISTYYPGTRTTALPISPISQSSADQRKGRCGRVENGVCIRLYSEEDYLSRELYTPPEILRANLAEVILRMISLNLGRIQDFPFVDPPPARRIRDGFNILSELGAIETAPAEKKAAAAGVRLTGKGKVMARLPVDPRLSRMLIEAEQNGCLGPVTVIAAALSVIDPRERPEGKEAQAEQARVAFVDPSSDFISLYNIFRACTQHSEASRPVVRAGELKRFCRQHYLSFKRMREWLDVYEQMADLLEESGLKIRPPDRSSVRPESEDKNGFPDLYAAVHKSVLSGFLSNIAQRKDKNIYQAAKQREVMIFPGSALFNRGGQWIVAAEIVETTRRFARTAANIDPKWLESIAGSQCKYTYTNARWDKKREAVVADEQVSLYGLIIVSGRTVPYGGIDPEAAAEIFIRSALIEGDVRTVLPFMEHNWSLAERIRDKENRIRRRELLAGEQDMVDFYQKRLACVSDMRTLKKKIRDAGGDDFLRMSEADLLAAEPDENELARFPDQIALGGRAFSCTYRFNPGGADDGVTVTVPASAAGEVSRQTTDWVVPGLLEEKITALIRGLPKSYRRQLVPVSETVARIMKKMPMYQGSLRSTVSRFIHEEFGVDIPASAWNESDLPDHLKLRFSLTDPEGRELAAGRDRGILEQGAQTDVSADAFREEKARWEQHGLTGWQQLPDLPDALTVTGGHRRQWPLYPRLEPAGKSVNLRLFTDRQQAESTHKKGVARLLAVYFSKEFKHLKKTAALPAPAAQQAVYFGGADAVAQQIAEKVENDLFAQDLRTKADFQKCAEENVNRILPAGVAIRDAVIEVIAAYHRARQIICRLENRFRNAPPTLAFLQQMRRQLAALVPENFITLYDLEQMCHLPRYMEAVCRRAERGVNDPDKDRARAGRLAVYEGYLQELIESLDASSSDEKRAAVEQFFWMIEEFKVSLFAQELKTAYPISEKRLKQKYREIRRMA